MATARDIMHAGAECIGESQTLKHAARQMRDLDVGALPICGDDGRLVGIVTERDILHAIGTGLDPDSEAVETHLTHNVVFATPHWTLDQAAEAMTRGGFRHLIVLEDDQVVGMISVRDIVRAWAALPSHA